MASHPQIRRLIKLALDLDVVTLLHAARVEFWLDLVEAQDAPRKQRRGQWLDRADLPFGRCLNFPGVRGEVADAVRLIRRQLRNPSR